MATAKRVDAPGSGEEGFPNRIIDIYSVFCEKCNIGIFPGKGGLKKGGRSYMNTQVWCCARCGSELLLEADGSAKRE